jgi:hypothetical protein
MWNIKRGGCVPFLNQLISGRQDRTDWEKVPDHFPPCLAHGRLLVGEWDEINAASVRSGRKLFNVKS